MKKTIRSMVVVLVMLFLGICVNMTDSQAAEDWNGASPVNVNEEFNGNVTQGYYKEQDRYSFSLEKAGMIQIHFSNPLQSDSEEYWIVTLVNGSYEEILETEIYGNHEKTDFTKLGLGAGTYYLKVVSSTGSNAKSKDTYSIRIDYTESTVWEKEFNEDFSSANEIATNEKYFGTTRNGYYKEKDIYLFSLSKPGVVSLLINNPLQPAKEDYWKVYLFNGEYKEINSWELSGSLTTHALTKIGLSTGTYYVRIESTTGSNPRSTDVYDLTVSYTESDYWEREFNEDFVSSNPIALGTKYNGTTHAGYYNEKDVYSIDIPSREEYTINFENPKQNSTDEYWMMYLYDSAYNETDKVEISGNKTSSVLKKVLDAGRYYIKITSTTGSNAQSVDPYTIYVTSKDVAPAPDPTTPPETPTETTNEEVTTLQNSVATISGIHGGKKRFSVYYSYSALTGVGFEIQFKLGKRGKWFSKKTPNMSLTVTGLRSRKKYFVRVRPYKMIDGVNYYGGWSTTRRIKVR